MSPPQPLLFYQSAELQLHWVPVQLKNNLASTNISHQSWESHRTISMGNLKNETNYAGKTELHSSSHIKNGLYTN